MSTVEIRKHREKDEIRLVEDIRVTFWHDGKECHALMTNLSTNGARLVLSKDTILQAILPIGKEVPFDVLTPSGCSLCRARIQWVEPESDPVSFGIEFTHVSQDASDPLRATIEARW